MWGRSPAIRRWEGTPLPKHVLTPFLRWTRDSRDIRWQTWRRNRAPAYRPSAASPLLDMTRCPFSVFSPEIELLSKSDADIEFLDRSANRAALSNLGYRPIMAVAATTSGALRHRREKKVSGKRRREVPEASLSRRVLEHGKHQPSPDMGTGLSVE
jgi:hypothetical protein